MRFSKIIFAAFTSIFVFNFPSVYAQQTTSKQINILHNYGSIPFEDGKTTIAEVKYIGFDSDYEKYDETVGKQLRKSDFLSELDWAKAKINADEKFSGAKVAKAVKILKIWLSKNSYLNSEVAAYGEVLPKNQMNLVFSVKRRNPAFVSEIRFDGNINVSNDELVNNFKECLGDRKLFEAGVYDYFANKCSRALLFSKGFFKAKIHSITPRLVSNSYVVEISIDEGIRYVYGTVKFEGATVFSKKQLIEILKWKTGEVTDGKHLQNSIYEDLKKAYADKGYIEYSAEFDPTFIEPQAEGLDGIFNIVVNIWEGKRYNLGRIKFIGINEDDKRKFLEMIPLKTGEIYNQSKLDEGIEKINELKQFLPIESMRGTLISKNEGYSGIEVKSPEDGSDVEVIIATRRLTEDERTYYKELFERRD